MSATKILRCEKETLEDGSFITVTIESENGFIFKCIYDEDNILVSKEDITDQLCVSDLSSYVDGAVNG